MISLVENAAWSAPHVRRLSCPLAVRLALPLIVSAIAGPASALGLGQLHGQSDLGAPFKGSIPLFGDGVDTVQSSCIKAKVLALDGSRIAVARVALSEAAKGRSLALSTTSVINEPAVTVSVELQCEQPMHREYQLLLNPPGLRFEEEKASRTAGVAGPQANTRPRFAEASRPAATPAAVSAAKPPAQHVAAPLASAAPVARAARPPKPDAAQRPARQAAPPPAPARNVLRLSSSAGSVQEDAEIERIALRLSTSLSLTDTEAAMPMAPAASLEAAADQNAAAEAEARLQAMAKKMEALQAEAQSATRLLRKDWRALQETRAREKTMQGWLAALIVFCVACLGVLAWFVRRMHLLQQGKRPRWDEWYSFDPTDTEPSLEPVIAEPADRKPDADVEEALRHAERTFPPAAGVVTVAAADVAETAEASAEEQTSAGSGNFMDWPAAPAPFVSTESSASRTALADKFLDEDGGHFLRKPAGLETKEVLDVIQQAEFWISLHNASSALELLEFYVYHSPDHDKSPLPWLLLFDLYREQDMEHQHLLLQDRFARTFGETPPPWKSEPAEGQRLGEPPLVPAASF